MTASITLDSVAIAEQVRSGAVTAAAVTDAALGEIERRDAALNCFTTVQADAARRAARDIDRRRQAGEALGPLAGVPFAIKNLFDIAGVTTVAGSKIHRDQPPALADATAVARLKAAGGVLIGALNMDEYAYGFVTENAHDGPTHNPHALDHVAGGSSGGSAAAVAGGLVPLTLGSDTNGSIRVPSAFCGIFGLKPTYGRLGRSGAMLFAESLDHIGPFARSVRDLALAFDLLQGPDPADPAATDRPPEPTLPSLGEGIGGLRIALAGGYFREGAMPEVLAGVDAVAKALGATAMVTLPQVLLARSAAFIITMVEGASLHLDDLKTRPQDFDPATRDRFLAGALIPSQLYVKAQRFRRWYRDQVAEVFNMVDIILAPCTPCPAPRIGEDKMVIGGVEMLTRPNLGIYTQPLSFIGLPVVAVPVQRPGALPVGVQVIAAPFQEAKALRVAAELEKLGVCAAPVMS
ncbi:MAG TPA: AtzE family amidohydrolase [Stellaceae bacterium]|nr:AtzE family amidohydrolase [Stellaceae bacterium]